MATSLAVPLAYITALVTALAIFSRVYRRRRLAAKTSFEPWFPSHPSRDIYISLLSSETPVPESLIKAALLVRATADVKRIWRIRDDKSALASLHARGLVGDDTMERFSVAERELEAEIVDVVQEANTFRQGWGGMIFQTATEMAHAERTRETVMNIPRVKALEEKRIATRKKYLPEPTATAAIAAQPAANGNDPAPETASGDSKLTPPDNSIPQVDTPRKGPLPTEPLENGSEASVKAGSPANGNNTPSKNTPSRKKKGKK